ncbi:unnamed protein product, partial [Polarella glacialis]
SDQFDKFLYFGTVHCRTDQTAFLLFLEFGLLPLLSREDWLVAPRLRKVTEVLLQAAEGVNASEVLLAWHGLCLLFGGNLRSRATLYLQDILLRLAFGYLTFIASGPPPGLGPPGGFVSPVVESMTDVEWSLAERSRPALRQSFALAARLVAETAEDKIDQLLSEFEGTLVSSTCSWRTKNLMPELRQFVSFVRDAIGTEEEAAGLASIC